MARGLPLAAGAHALAPHARAAEGADGAAAGFCGDRGVRNPVLIPCWGRSGSVRLLSGIWRGAARSSPRSARLGGWDGGSKALNSLRN